jgi:putative conjugative transposon protein
MYLFDEQPILANKALARELGLNEALVLQQINYWIEINKKSGNNYHDGKYWTYNSIRAWQEKDFDYLSVDTVKRTFSKLEKAGYLLVGNYNKDPRDKTKWYTINDNKLEELYLELNQRKQEKEREILEQVSKSAIPNALGQNQPVHYGDLHEPLPEITTNNSSKITSYISTENSSHLPIYEKDIFYLRDGMEDGCKKIKSYKSCLEELRESTGYNEHMKLGNKIVAKTFDEIIKVLADVMVLNAEDTVTINQTKLPAYVVQERFRELDSLHMEYLVNALSENESKIRNVRAFILTAAYNAPSNMDAYYTALVSYDMRVGGY